MSDREKILDEWFERGWHDISSAKLLFENRHYTDTVAVLVQQAVEKYLKGLLCYQGWKLKKTHDLEELLTEVSKYEKSFLNYLDFARTATGYYIEDRYPPGPPQDYSREEIGGVLSTAEELIEKIKKIARK